MAGTAYITYRPRSTQLKRPNYTKYSPKPPDATNTYMATTTAATTTAATMSAFLRLTLFSLVGCNWLEVEMWPVVESPVGTVISSSSVIARTASPTVRESVSRLISAVVSPRTAARTGIVVPPVTESIMTMAVLAAESLGLNPFHPAKSRDASAGTDYADGARIANGECARSVRPISMVGRL